MTFDDFDEMVKQKKKRFNERAEAAQADFLKSKKQVQTEYKDKQKDAQTAFVSGKADRDSEFEEVSESFMEEQARMRDEQREIEEQEKLFQEQMQESDFLKKLRHSDEAVDRFKDRQRKKKP